MKLEMTDLIYHNLIPIYINNTKGKYPFTVSHPKFDTPGLNQKTRWICHLCGSKLGLGYRT